MPIRIAIDGPAGSGKGTVSRIIARELGIPYIETGALYRAVAFYLKERGLIEGKELKASDEEIARALREVSITQEYVDGEARTYLDGRDITDLIRTAEIGQLASVVSARKVVRDYLLDLQRKLAEKGGVIEGRDIGTVVLPDADVKIFLTATLEERARRKANQLGIPYEKALRELKERDERDMNREVAPLRRAPDAILIDSTDMSVEEVVERILQIARRKLREKSLTDESAP